MDGVCIASLFGLEVAMALELMSLDSPLIDGIARIFVSRTNFFVKEVYWLAYPTSSSKAK